MMYYCEGCGNLYDSDQTVGVDEVDGTIICEDCAEERHEDDDFYAEG